MRLFKVIIILLFPLQLFASHIVGGEMYYDCLGNNQYKITLKVYRDCHSNGALYDDPLNLGIFDQGNNSLVRMEQINYPGSTTIPVTFNNPCVNAPTDICVEEAIYTKTIILPANADGYLLAYERCCRGGTISNLMNPAEQGLTITARIPGTNSGISCNSSPRFNNYPPLLLCNNEPLIFDHSATDPDGDSLVYELSTPYDGGSQADPMPLPTNNPPYNLIVWGTGYSATQPFGPTVPISINSQTGELHASPDVSGKFVVGVNVKEYRNGVLIGSTLRDFLFIVFNCTYSMHADIVSQEDLSTFNSYCDGFTIDFENNSNGAQVYLWDFGVPSDPNATSSLAEPSYTFPSEGTYTVTLIINPGWACADTSVKTFKVYDNIDVHFNPPGTQCITNNSFDFVGEGNYDVGSSFNWNFGNHATPSNATTENVNNVNFDTTGYIPVTFHVTSNDCEQTYLDSIKVDRIPTIDFDLLPGLYCAPQKVYFIDSSLSDEPLTYLWDFGDGNTSTEPNPTNTYQGSGTYDVSLDISTQIGCIANLTLAFPGLIEIFPSPVANFSVSPEITDVFHTEITITDQSEDSQTLLYQLTPDVDTTKRNLTYNYVEGGYHNVYQIVTNKFGCKDTAERSIYVKPHTTLYVPNAFTPNNDGYNDVFSPVVYDITQYKFTIYNRWGEQIFTTNDSKEGWDGRYQERKAPDGIYIWKIEFHNHRDIGEIHHGHFTLLQ